jgi:acetylornithine deacetylase/succinyl-diaminopimelate desuccinylase-like protein
MTDIRNFLQSQREPQTRFLAELVKVPSDNPPGDCQRHADRTATLLRELGFEVEEHDQLHQSRRATAFWQ